MQQGALSLARDRRWPAIGPTLLLILAGVVLPNSVSLVSLVAGIGMPPRTPAIAAYAAVALAARFMPRAATIVLYLAVVVYDTISTIALLFGYRFIRTRRIPQHRAAMFTAFFFSTIFLGSYLVNFALHGETRFDRHSAWWPFYWKLLASHIVLSTIALPLILITFFLSLTGRFPTHRRLARYTFPIWLYVSVTGVIVYAMQSLIH